jgi:predicted DNA-binding mobile mystery protein A
MSTRSATRQARETLDRRLAPLGPAARYAPPRLGWIRAVRDALGMSAKDLATRLGVTGYAVRSMEEGERTGGIRLDSLRRAAEAMDCSLIYAFIPNGSLEQTVQHQARWILDEQVGRARQTMALEAQEAEMSPSSVDAQLKSIVDSGRIWSWTGSQK